jgi:hypothetical protein
MNKESSTDLTTRWAEVSWSELDLCDIVKVGLYGME